MGKLFLPIILNGKCVYAGFWIRLRAALINAVVLLPFMFSFIWLETVNKNLAIVITFLSPALFFIYTIYFNVCFGGTLGKLAVGIRITKPDGARIGWPEVWKRSGVDIVLGLVMLCIEVWALSHVNDERYIASTFIQQRQLIQSHYPFYFSISNISQNIWFLSQPIVLLLNKRKRATHDFIAGTVVIHKEFMNLKNEKI